MKTLLILLFLALPISAGDWTDIDVDTTWTYPYFRNDYTPKDTVRYYVFDVKERTKCDTFMIQIPCPGYNYGDGAMCAVLHSRTIIECDDTTWAPKIQIYLTPTELEQLMKLLKE